MIFEFFDTTLANSGNSVEEYINTITRLTDDLNVRDLKLPDKLIMAWVLNHLTPKYEGFVSNITQSYRIDGAKFDLQGLFSNLLDESRRLAYKDDDIAQVLAAKGSKSTKKYTHCKKKGHYIETCYQLYPELKPGGREEVVTLTEVVLPAIETAMPVLRLWAAMKVFMYNLKRETGVWLDTIGVFCTPPLGLQTQGKLLYIFCPLAIASNECMINQKKIIYESGHFPASLLRWSPWPKSNRDCIKEAPFPVQNRRHDVLSDMIEPKRTALIDERLLQ